jgi:hypothetical protein
MDNNVNCLRPSGQYSSSSTGNRAFECFMARDRPLGHFTALEVIERFWFHGFVPEVLGDAVISAVAMTFHATLLVAQQMTGPIRTDLANLARVVTLCGPMTGLSFWPTSHVYRLDNASAIMRSSPF